MRNLFCILFFCLLTITIAACSLQIENASGPTSETAPAVATESTLVGSIAEIPRPTPTAAALGTIENPLVLALLPGSAANGDRVSGGKALADQLSEVTGYTFVVVAPESYSKLVEAMGQGNAHVAVLSAYAYALAYREGFATATYASIRSGEKAYGAQFIARTDAGFKSYYDAYRDVNTADAATALSQFRDKKPCWSDQASPSGYVIPAGILAANDFSIRPAAVVQGQPAVVRAVYDGGICDFGATYIDARTFPAVLDRYPDLLDQVSVIWHVPPIIPFETMVFSRNLPPEIALAINDAMFRISGMQVGRDALGQAYDIEEWERISDSFYDEFRLYVDASGVDLKNILDQ